MKSIPFDIAQAEVEKVIAEATRLVRSARSGTNAMGDRLPYEVPRDRMAALRAALRSLREKAQA